jgi:hypothetical protein
VRALELYLNRNPHLVNAPTVFQSKLIHIATKTGQSEIVQLLLDLGADVGALDYGTVKTTTLPSPFTSLLRQIQGSTSINISRKAIAVQAAVQASHCVCSQAA